MANDGTKIWEVTTEFETEIVQTRVVQTTLIQAEVVSSGAEKLLKTK
jgi:hypothetical protein